MPIRVQAWKYFWWAAHGIGKQRVYLNIFAPGGGFRRALKDEGWTISHTGQHMESRGWYSLQPPRLALDPEEGKAIEGWAVREALMSQQKVSCTRVEEGGSHGKRKCCHCIGKSERSQISTSVLQEDTLNYSQPPFWEDHGVFVSLCLLFTVCYLQFAQIPAACWYYWGFEFRDRLRNRLSKCICHLSLIIVFGTSLDYSRYLAIQ